MDALTRLPHIYDIATSDRNWTRALDQFAAVSGSKGAALFASNNTPDEFLVSETNAFFHSRQASLAEYVRQFSRFDAQSVPFINASRPFEWIPETDIWPDLDLQASREDLRFLRQNFGFGRIGGINVSTNPAYVAVIALQFDQVVQRPLLNSEFETKLIASHLGKALEINRFYSQLRKRYDAVLTVLDKIDAALCILLPSGEVIVHNKKAQRIFEDRNGISLTRENHLSLRDEDQTEKLRSYARECCETAAGRNSQPERLVKASKNSIGDSYLIEVSPLRDGDDELNENLFGAMMTIIDPQDPPKLSIEAAAKLYGLTSAETAVSGLLIEGKILPEIADIRGVSATTVRNQARSIHQKLDVRNRAELIRKVSAVSPPVLG